MQVWEKPRKLVNIYSGCFGSILIFKTSVKIGTSFFLGDKFLVCI